MRISDWSSDVCSSDLPAAIGILIALECGGDDHRGAVWLAGGQGFVEQRVERGEGFNEQRIGIVHWADRKSVVSGKSVSVRVDPGGRRSIEKKKQLTNNTLDNKYCIRKIN